jgi:hypothetical protein
MPAEVDPGRPPDALRHEVLGKALEDIMRLMRLVVALLDDEPEPVEGLVLPGWARPKHWPDPPPPGRSNGFGGSYGGHGG